MNAPATTSTEPEAAMPWQQQTRLAVPLLIVTLFAVYGQVLYGIDAYTPPSLPWLYRAGIALGAAVGVESIALYVAWHAHDALMSGNTGTAARLRRASYGIALLVATLNYAHFSLPGGGPTPAAVMFFLFSAASPWLWGLHTRRAHHAQLVRERRLDDAGAVFSAQRMRAFPYRTFMARRWSIDHGVTDPEQAWRGYNAERAGAPVPTVAAAVERTVLMQAVALAMRAQPVQVSAAPRAPRPHRPRVERVERPTRRRTAGAPALSKLPPKEWAEKELAEGRAVTGGRIKMATGCSKSYAYKVAAEVAS